MPITIWLVYVADEGGCAVRCCYTTEAGAQAHCDKYNRINAPTHWRERLQTEPIDLHPE